MYQVILKNTSAAANRVPSPTHINRSQSLLTTNTRVPVLAPTRNERVRLETLLMDVWSRDVLPYPGMSFKARNEHIVRSSASTMMRKLSVVSITGSFGKKAGANSSGLDMLEPPGAVTQDDSRSGDSTRSCSSSVHSCNGRLIKRPRTQNLREKGGGTGTRNTSSGTMQVLELTKIVVDSKQIPDEKSETAGLSASASDHQPSMSLGSVKSDSCSLGKENACPPTEVESKKQGRRWGRAGGLRNDGTSQGLRSLFR